LRGDSTSYTEAVGRLWLALALVIASVAPAFATVPHVPGEPKITSAYLEVGDQRTSAGLYDVELLQLAGTFDRYTSIVRIRLHTASGDQVLETTPDQLQLVQPKLLSPVGTVTLDVISSDGRLDSEPTRVTVVAQRHRRPDSPAGMLFMLLVWGAAAVGMVGMVAVLFSMRATEAERARVRRATDPSPLLAAAAEEHIRTVALRALFSLVVVAAIVVVTIATDILFIPIVGAPMLLVIALPALLRVVNAGRAIALLHRPDASAQTRLDQLEVFAASRHVTLRSSPKLVERARRHALPKATL